MLGKTIRDIWSGETKRQKMCTKSQSKLQKWQQKDLNASILALASDLTIY